MKKVNNHHYKFIVLLIIYCLLCEIVTAVPYRKNLDFLINNNMRYDNNLMMRSSPGPGTGRIFWSAIGDWINSSDWFPVELSIPQIFNGIGQGIGNMWSYITGGGAQKEKPCTSCNENDEEVPVYTSNIINNNSNNNINKNKKKKKKLKKKVSNNKLKPYVGTQRPVWIVVLNKELDDVKEILPNKYKYNHL